MTTWLSRLRAKLLAFVGALFLSAAPPLTASGTLLTEPAPTSLAFAANGSLVSWQQNLNALAYELEVFAAPAPGLDANAEDSRAVFRTTAVYHHVYNLPARDLAATAQASTLWWRVRVLGWQRRPLSPFSGLATLAVTPAVAPLAAPMPIATPATERGGAMLYPVYSWVRQYGAESFQVQVFADAPERAASPALEMSSPVAELYDPEPRLGKFWWRVRSFGADGLPLGTWSRFVFCQTPPRAHRVAVFGDSVSHGGGHISYGPEELAYSWLHYLDFDALNLAQSGDTTAAMLARFERDVLPFRPEYLLIMGGVNDLRSDEYTAESVIANLEAVRTKCLQHDIRPVLMTLPPINPANIARAFDEETDPRWRDKFALVNNYIRTRVHIDAARLFPEGELPEPLALDGLHPDIAGKRLIAQAVNEGWRQARKAADRTFVAVRR